MDELRDIKVKITVAEDDFNQAKLANDRDLIKVYGNLLTRLIERQNILESQSGNFLSIPLPNIIRLENSILISFR